MVSGSAGKGKTSPAANFTYEACKNNERCLFFAFEESPQQIVRNMKSIGVNFDHYLKKDILRFYASHASVYEMEMHLVAINKTIRKFKPSVVIIDPISNFMSQGNINEVKGMLLRLIFCRLS